MAGEVDPEAHAVLVEVVLEANASTGFTWRVVEPLDPRLAFVDQAYAGAAPMGPGGLPIVGAPGQATLRFKAVAAGEVKLVLRYARPWEQPGAPGVEGMERTFTVVVQ
jgi:predicted secreted protein